MDGKQYNTLQAALLTVPDVRKARGKRHSWSLLVTVIAGAMSSGASSGKAVRRWMEARKEELLVALAPERGLPSESTLRRVLRQMPIAALEEALARFVQQTSASATSPDDAPVPSWQGQSVDGKDVRGLRKYGMRLHLVSLVQHEPTLVLGQVAVTKKQNEISAVPTLLAGRKLWGTVTTMDALLCQRPVCEQILAQQGHYLTVVKANHPTLYQDIALLFEGNSWTVQEKQQEYQRVHAHEKGHGRIESRTLETSTSLAGYLDWPGVQQVLRRQTRRTHVKSGQTTTKTTYAITSLTRSQADAPVLAALWRAHWTIENRLHYVRDVAFREDAGQVRAGNAPHALAALRNAILNCLRLQGWHSIPDAFEHHAASLSHALMLIGALAPPSL